MKNPSSKRADAQSTPKHLQRKLLVAGVAACFIGAVHANPSAPQVVAGQASFNQQGNLFSITNTPNTIINWQSFSIGAGDITRFIQQNSDSKVLNRITGQDPSQILGALQSNGKVFLINPNGVMFGAGSRVDVNGLVASSLNISDADFLAGKNNFVGSASAGKVSNQGTITTPGGGQVYLIAPSVENSGIITSPNGDIVLAAGESVQLVDSANPDVHVQVSAPADQALNLGQIVAQGGRVGIYGALVNQRGHISADSAVRGDAGQIILKSSGTTLLEAGSTTTAASAGGTGGAIELLGPQVGLTGNAKVDASGATGGGSVLVGGDRQGLNPAVQNARASFVGSDAVISADAVNSGNGGKVIVWSDDATRMYGAISARGGATGGAGGFVETSGHYLDVNGARVDTTAHGHVGQWLLDPWDLTVVTSGSTTTLGSVAEFDSSTSGATTINASTINAATSDVTLSAGHDLTFNAGVTLASGLALTGQAKHDIVVNAPLTTSGGALTLSANQGGGGGKIVSNADQSGIFGDIESNGGAISLNADSVNLQAPLNAGSGTLSILTTSNTGAITLAPGGNGAISAASATIGGGPIAINGHLVVTGALDLNAGTAAITSNSNALIASPSVHADGGSVTLANLTSTTGTVGLTGSASGGDFTASATGGMFIASGPGFGITSTTAIRLTAGDLGITEDSSSRVSAPILQLSTPGIVSLTASASNQIGALEGTSLGSLSYSQDASGALTLGAEGRGVSVVGGDQQLSVSTGGALNVVNNVNSGGNALFLTGSTIHISNNATVTGSDTTELTANGNGLLGYNGSITIDSGSKLLGNHIELSANEMILNGAISATPFGSDDPSSITLRPSSGERSVVIGANAADVAANSDGMGGSLGLSQADLLNVSADTLTIGLSNPNSDTGALSMNGALNLGATSSKIGTLVLQGNGVALGASLTTGAAVSVISSDSLSNAGTLSARSLTFSANSISNSGTLSANTLTLNADQITLGTINANNGAGTVNINTVGESTGIEFSGADATDGGALHLNVADLAGVNAGNLNFSGYSVSVLSPISLPHTNLNFTTNGFFGNNYAAPFDVEAAVTGKAVGMVSSGDMTINGAINGSAIFLRAGNEQPSTLTVSAPVTGSVSADLQAYRTVNIAAGGAVSAPLVSITALDGSDESSTLTVAGSVTGTGSTGSVSLAADSISIASGGAVSAPLVAVQALPESDFSGTITVDGSITGTGGHANMVLSSNSVLVDAGALVSAGTGGNLDLQGDAISLNADVVAGLAAVHPYTDGLNITLGYSSALANNSTLDGNGCANGPCLSFRDLVHVKAPIIGIGSSPATITTDFFTGGGGGGGGGGAASGDIAVVGISAPGGSGWTDRNAITTRIGLLSGGAVTQYGAIDVHDLGVIAGDNVELTNTGNHVGSLAVSQATCVVVGDALCRLRFDNNQSLSIARLTGTLNDGSLYDINGVSTPGLATFVVGGALTRAAGSAPGDAVLTAAGLTVTSSGGVGTVPAPLLTSVRTLDVTNNGVGSDPINIQNVDQIVGGNKVALLVDKVTQAGSGNSGIIHIDNTGEMDVGATGDSSTGVFTVNGNITLQTHSPLVINGDVSSSGGSISLSAGPGGVNDTLTLSAGSVVSTSTGTIALVAGDAIVQGGTLTGTQLPAQSGVNAANAGGGAPTLSACIANPSTPGCSAVLPTLGSCTANPTAQGCSVVLPTLSQCTVNPTAPGCSAVLPTLSQCTVNPAAPGCSAVLPTLSQCTANPAAPGCAAVLPTLGSCTANPTAPGCSAVLPTLAQCTTNPTQSGCAAVLPTLTSCTVNPGAPGCSAVLPTLAQCSAHPTQAGCSAVLPSLATCVANPATPACVLVLPSLNSCVATPSLAGCSAVLPSLASCAANPSAAGCSAVLPTLTACVANPAAAGCAAVLPSLAQCSSTPSLAGCSAVLPSVASCTANPAQAGCSVVLPSVAACVANPSLPGCTTTTPPPSSICSIAPDSALCQTLIPPVASQSTPNAPLTVALNQTVQLVNTTTPTTTPPATPTSGGGGNSSTNSTSSPTGGNASTSTNPGVSNDTAKKMYCN